MFHDMGLIGDTLTPLYAGYPCVKMTPAHFLRDPLAWLQNVTLHRGTTIGAPNFAYDLCVDSIPEASLAHLDLSTLETAYCGAEPVRASTLLRFTDRFKAYGFNPKRWHPCYGLAEATLMVSGGYLEAFPRMSNAVETPESSVKADPESELVSCGRICDSQIAAIVDSETCTKLQEGEVGEVWVKGPSVSRGYWNSPESNANTFNQFTTDGDEGFLRTGDVGFMHNGELFICGRIKDLMIVNGRKFHAEDIEQTVRECDGSLRLARCAAFSIHSEMTERIAILLECGRWQMETMGPRWVSAISRAMFTKHSLSIRDIRLTQRGTLPMTSSGKVRRKACGELYQKLLLSDAAGAIKGGG